MCILIRFLGSLLHQVETLSKTCQFSKKSTPPILQARFFSLWIGSFGPKNASNVHILGVCAFSQANIGV